MDVATRELVRQRAIQRCEYCHIPDHALDLPFHVEHIVASIHRPDNRPSNLAWFCPRCNLKKGPNLTTIDPETDQPVDLYNPRAMTWTDHFVVHDAEVISITSCGRGTVRLLDLNNHLRVQHRRLLIEQDDFDLD